MIDDGTTEPGGLERDRGRPLGERTTDPGDATAASGGARGLGDTDDTDPLYAAAPPGGSFEHRRIVSVARQRLFGRGRTLTIGRYPVDRRLGVGGMGEVYLAHDADLDRKVAIKRVHARSPRARDQQRLRQEARALARLSHPHVVQVYEVGEHEGQTYLAMEYVDGQTLGQWLAAQPRSWRAVLERMIAAGQGLAAAHEVGLVHRDFKPDNVLLGHDGSVRVADFGVALVGGDGRARPPEAPALPSPEGPTSSVSVLGTIRYMSLEQLRGDEVDARSDQFSYCVTLYEALWGEPPFSLESSLARWSELQAGKAATPRRRGGPRVPARLWPVVRRGLSRDPAERWPDMRALLAALSEVDRRRRRWWAGGVATVAVATLGVSSMLEPPAPEPCLGVEHELDGTWDEARREAVRASFDRATAPHASSTAARLIEGLDRWSARWIDARRHTCEGRAEGRLAPELARQQDLCLARLRHGTADLVELLERPSPSPATLARAMDAVSELPPPSRCEDALALLGLEAPPEAIAERVESLRHDLGRARQLRTLARFDEAARVAEHTEHAARALGYSPLVAEALAERSRIVLDGGSLRDGLVLVQDAIDAAELARHEALAAELWTEATLHTLSIATEPTLGAWLLRRAEIAQARLGSGTRQRARLELARAQLAELRGDHGAAEEHYRRALALTENDETAAVDAPTYAADLATFVGMQDPRSTEAIALYRAALDSAEQRYGRDHPRTARLAYLLAAAVEPQEPAEATALFERAAGAWSSHDLPPSPDLLRLRFLLGRLALSSGQLDVAREHALAVATLAAEVYPADHPARGDGAHMLGTIHSIEGDHEHALLYLREAIAAWEPAFGPGSAHVHRLRSDAVSNLLALGRLDEAEAELALVLPLAIGGSEEVSVRLQQCELALRRGAVEQADTQLRALEALGDHLGDHELSYAVLRALVDLRRGALDAAVQARLQRARADTPFTADQVKRWLDRLEPSDAEREHLAID